MAEETGQRVGDYEVIALLGSGGMGRVYKVRSVISNREEAMKILLPDFASEQELAARFMAEIRTLAGLDHPNITQLRTAFQVQNQFVMVMEYVEGTSLDKLHAQLPLDRAIDYSTQVLAALSYAHGKGVTHRDIKPANIMITTHGVVKLMDFGIAKSTTDLNLTRPGTTMGSIYYMSPEQVRGGTVDGRSDIYSFGVTLYEMITGRKPFQAETSYSVLNAQLNEAPAPPAQWNPALSRELNDIVLRAMAKDPGARFQSADEFRSALKALREAHPAGAPAVAAAGVAAAVAAPIPAFASSGAQVASSGAQATPAFQPTAPVPTAAPGFAPVPVAVAPPPSKSHRGLWIGLGALAAVLALVAAATVLPRFFPTHAGVKPAQVASNAAPGNGGASTAVQPSGSVTPPPGSNPGAPGSAGPAGGAAPAGAVVPALGAPTAPKLAAGSPKQTVVAPVVNKAAVQPAPNPPPVQQIVPVNPPAPPPGPTPEEIHHARDRFMDIDARADAVTGQFESMRREQQSHGYDMRGDMVGALNRMNNDIREADRAINERDLDSARDYMDKANEELHKLEQFLGR
jgi:tRNA A-37 threonylcarbamoyl transferase component Bud32